jgi:hypothetical protein
VESPRFAHVAAARALLELVAQVGEGGVGPVALEQSVDPLLPTPAASWAGEAKHAALGSGFFKRG